MRDKIRKKNREKTSKNNRAMDLKTKKISSKFRKRKLRLL